MNHDHPENHIPSTVSANLDARLAPFFHAPRDGTGARDETVHAAGRCSPSNATSAGIPRRHLLDELKLLFASLGAGNSVVPLGDNSQAARLLGDYARSLRARRH